MRKLLDAVGPLPRVIVAILGVVVAGLVALGLLFLVADEVTALFGALALAIIVAVPMTIVYVVARVVARPAAPTVVLPPPAAGNSQPHLFTDQQLHNPDDLR